MESFPQKFPWETFFNILEMIWNQNFIRLIYHKPNQNNIYIYVFIFEKYLYIFILIDFFFHRKIE